MLVVTLFFGFGLVVSASSSARGSLDGRAVTGHVAIANHNASGQTTVSAEPHYASTRVDLTYVYRSTRNNQNSTRTITNIGHNQANSYLSTPDQMNYISVRASAKHTATYSGQTWTANTNITR